MLVRLAICLSTVSWFIYQSLTSWSRFWVDRPEVDCTRMRRIVFGHVTTAGRPSRCISLTTQHFTYLLTHDSLVLAYKGYFPATRNDLRCVTTKRLSCCSLQRPWKSIMFVIICWDEFCILVESNVSKIFETFIYFYCLFSSVCVNSCFNYVIRYSAIDVVISSSRC